MQLVRCDARRRSLALSLLMLVWLGCQAAGFDHDVIIRQGLVYDGRGGPPYTADVALDGDRVAAIGDLADRRGKNEIDAGGLAVAPGFINMLSWANESLLHDGRSMSDIHQGVTLEVMGEGHSMGPMTPKMRESRLERQQDIRYEIPWNTLGGYLEHLEERGVSTNVASFVGATTVRIFVVGSEDRAATPAEVETMQALVREAMAEGALGVASSLPYAPAVFASTDELIALATAAAEFDGMYISHIRSEGDEIREALDEFLTIVRKTGIRGEVYHLKSSQKQNWDKLDEVIATLEAARAEGLAVGADIYPYHASSTSLAINFPAWVKEGDHADFVARLQDPDVRRLMHDEMDLIPPEDIVLVSFRQQEMRHLTGKTLAEVAEMWSVTPEVAAMDLIVRDDSRVGTVRFTMSEENVRKKMVLPWVTFCSDGGSVAPEPPFTYSQPHPRSYGAFARVLGRYSREEKLITLEEAVHRFTELPATNLRLNHRGLLAPGYFADVVVFDPESIIDRATFEDPHQLAEGVLHVFVNGDQVLRDGQHTGATPGRFVRGPGWPGWPGRPGSNGEPGSEGARSDNREEEV